MRETDDFDLDAVFGKWLAELRKRSALTLHDVAARTGMEAARIQSLELGYSERGIKPREAQALCQVYGVPLEEMLSRASGETLA